MSYKFEKNLGPFNAETEAGQDLVADFNLCEKKKPLTCWKKIPYDMPYPVQRSEKAF